LTSLVLTQPRRWLQLALALIPITACIPMAIMISSRSFALLSSIALAFGLLFALRARIRRSVLAVVAVICFTGAVAGAILFLLSVTAPERVDALNERLFHDSRTSQYTQFFQQVPVEGLILGLGPKAAYTYKGRPNFQYIDNQVLYILFKLGLPVLIGYCAVVLWPGLRLLIKPAYQPQRMEGIVFILWILACLGLSIFHGILPNPSNFAIILLAGRAFTLASAASVTSSPIHTKPSWGRRDAVPRTAASVAAELGRAIVVLK
jgi:O-antigen ligase